MTRQTIVKALENNKRLGVQMKTEPNFVGWYIIYKRRPVDNFTKFANIVDQNYLKEQNEIIEKPYCIVEAKVSVDIFQRGEIYTNADYSIKQNYYFKSLNDGLDFLYKLNYTNEEIVWLVDLKYLS